MCGPSSGRGGGGGFGVVGEWKGDMDIEKELSSDEDDFDGLDMHV